MQLNELCAYVQVTHLNVLTRSFKSVEMSLMVRCSGPTMLLRLQVTGANTQTGYGAANIQASVYAAGKLY